MAARAYFRRGDQDLPRRGTFHYEGTQVVTGARARAAAEAQARRRVQRDPQVRADAATDVRTRPAARPRPQTRPADPGDAAAATTSITPLADEGSRAVPDTAAGISRDPRRIPVIREAWRRRMSAATWPSLGERLLLALVAWAPIALVVGFGGAAASGCATGLPSCPQNLATIQAVTIALALGLLVALPKVAYAGALASVGALFVGLGIVGALALLGADVPLSVETSAAVLLALLGGYAATGALVVLRGDATRPWYAGPRE
jgi:hypothetical protein